jgi:hypothetical protein
MGSNYVHVTIQSHSLDTRLFWNIGIYSLKLVAPTWPKCEPLEEAVDCSAAAAQHKHTTAQPLWPPGIVRLDPVYSGGQKRGHRCVPFATRVYARTPPLMFALYLDPSIKAMPARWPILQRQVHQRDWETQGPKYVFKACRFFLENGVMVPLQGQFLNVKSMLCWAENAPKRLQLETGDFGFPYPMLALVGFNALKAWKHRWLLNKPLVKAILGLLMSCGTWGI